MNKTKCFLTAIACLTLALSACTSGEENQTAPSAAKTTADKRTKSAPAKVDTPPVPTKKTSADFVKTLQGGFDMFNKGDMDGFGKLFADNATLEFVDLGQPVAEGRDAVLAAIGMFRTAIPDLKGESVMMLAEGNRVVSVDIMYGTHKGELMGVPASNKPVGVQVAHIYEMNDAGLIQKEWAYFDAGSLMGQIGAHKMPHRAAAKPTGANGAAVIATGDAKEKSNLEILTKTDAAMNARDMETAMAAFADDMIMSDMTMPEDIKGKDKIKAMFDMWMTGFPDMKLNSEWSFAAGDYVVRAGTLAGTNKGAVPAMGLKKATGKPVQVRMVEVIHVQDGKAKQSWGFSNGMAVAMQLGLIPPAK